MKNQAGRFQGELTIGGATYRILDIRAALGEELVQFPHVLRIMLENALRHAPDPASVVEQLKGWLAEGRSDAVIQFRPNRLMMHDTTCVPAFVDIAGMREAVSEAGGDPGRLNPAIPIDVSIDHSVSVDKYASRGAADFNMVRELERNSERYRFMKWASQAMDSIRLHPPGTGIMHTINLEQLATVVSSRVEDGDTWLVPDTLLGTDSHTPMVNGIGVLAWGIGGLEAETVMFGSPAELRIPDVVGVHLTGRLREGVTATDLALVVTQRLRQLGLQGDFVEFFGNGVVSLSAGSRAVIANMAPEYGASTGFFPVDQRTLAYLASTGRQPQALALVEAYSKRQGLWFDPRETPHFTRRIAIDLAEIATSISGPSRPQDLIRPGDAAATLRPLFSNPATQIARPGSWLEDGSVAIAAITSCTNTSDPRLVVAAGLLARKARALGLAPRPWVKTSFAPGSPAAERYLERSGLNKDLEALGFGTVGYGCTTCIGNSGPLPDVVAQAMKERGITPVAVLSGNRNFSGRVHPDLVANFLASPPLVVAYAIAGTAMIDITADPIAVAADGQSVFLADIWPKDEEVDAALAAATRPGDFTEAFEAAQNSASWTRIEVPSTPLFPWDTASTYLRRPPFVTASAKSRLGHYEAVPLLTLGDDITTDHISPAGRVPAASEAGRWLIDHGENPGDLNVYAARRGHWEVMRRGLFTNRTVRNIIAPDLPPGWTVHVPTGEQLPLWEAAERYAAEGESTVMFAGERYGTGSSRDWAAKGLALLGIRAVFAVSFERIHRTNLIGMGILPLLLPASHHPKTLGIQPRDRVEVAAVRQGLEPGQMIEVKLHRAVGGVEAFSARAAVYTDTDVSDLEAGGALPRNIRRALAPAPDIEPRARRTG